MAFSEFEISAHQLTIEKLFWSKHRPPVHVRDQVREGQRITGHEIELFLVRPLYSDPSRLAEEPIVKLRFVRARGVWQLLWKRASSRWSKYQPHPEADSLEEALRVVSRDAHGCFFG